MLVDFLLLRHSVVYLVFQRRIRMFAIMLALNSLVTLLDLLILLDRVFAVRLVLTGPAPCELVDAKICLTFRIFVKLPSGSMFCSTQDLELVRPEVFIR